MDPRTAARKASLLAQVDTLIANMAADTTLPPKTAPKGKLRGPVAGQDPLVPHDVKPVVTHKVQLNSLKRKRGVKWGEPFQTVIKGEDEGFAASQTKPRKEAKMPPGMLPQNKRLAIFQKTPARAYETKLLRALTQPMYIIDRTRVERTLPEDPSFTYPTEKLEIIGTTGNLYTVTIDRLPRCNCPNARRENICKHKIYIFNRVLKAERVHCYQRGLTAQELCEIFAAAPPIPPATPEDRGTQNKRKPIDGDCPICFTDFDEDQGDAEIVWCRAACGNNIHRHCFEQWAASSKTSEFTPVVSEVRCPLCRAPWQGDPDMVRRAVQIAKQQGRLNMSGYLNVADQLGMDTQHDTSTYHPFLVHRQVHGRVVFDDARGDAEMSG